MHSAMEGYVFTKNNAYKVSQRIGGRIIQCRRCNEKNAEDRKKGIYAYMCAQTHIHAHATYVRPPFFSYISPKRDLT